jgi:hypothetical protein
MDHWDCTRDQTSFVVSLRPFLKQDVSNAPPHHPVLLCALAVLPCGCTLLTTITTLIPFVLCFILLATAVMMFEVVLEEKLDPRHSGDTGKASYKKVGGA